MGKSKIPPSKNIINFFNVRYRARKNIYFYINIITKNIPLETSPIGLFTKKM